MPDLRARVERGAGQGDALSLLAATFLRGLSLGALVGAAIAGSAIWRRMRATPNDANDPAPTQEPAQRKDPI